MLRRERVNTIEESTLEECGVHTVGDVRGAYGLLSGLRVLPTDFDLTSKEHHHREAMTIRKTLGMVVRSSFNEMIDEWTTEIIALIRRAYCTFTQVTVAMSVLYILFISINFYLMQSVQCPVEVVLLVQ